MEEQYQALNAAETFAACESLWADANARETVRGLYEAACEDFSRQVIVLDDDPTGVQTVHGISVVTDWREETLKEALQAGDRMTRRSPANCSARSSGRAAALP